MKIEEELKKLEEITTRLEKDDLPLDEAISLFEEGLTLATSVKKSLEEAKLRIEKVVAETKGTFSLEPFELS